MFSCITKLTCCIFAFLKIFCNLFFMPMNYLKLFLYIFIFPCNFSEFTNFYIIWNIRICFMTLFVTYYGKVHAHLRIIYQCLLGNVMQVSHNFQFTFPFGRCTEWLNQLAFLKGCVLICLVFFISVFSSLWGHSS